MVESPFCLYPGAMFFHSPFKASTRIELVIEVLQTFALPLGYDALSVTPTGFEPMLSP